MVFFCVESFVALEMPLFALFALFPWTGKDVDAGLRRHDGFEGGRAAYSMSQIGSFSFPRNCSWADFWSGVGVIRRMARVAGAW